MKIYPMKFNIPALIIALLLTGCSWVEDSGTECPVSDNITLSFQMLSANIGTRADSNPLHSETDSEWQAFEDLIDVNDFAFYIFADVEDDTPLVMKVTDIAGSTDPNMMITGSPGAYTVSTVIPRKNLEDLLGYELSPGSSKVLNFRIVVLANAQGAGDYADIVSDNPNFTTFWERVKEWNFNMDAIYSNNSGDSGINGLYKGAIPMFGMSAFGITEDALYESRPDDRIWLGDIWMLRALAKVRVIDNIGTRNVTTGLPRIEEVTVQSATNLAKQLPLNAPMYVNGSQVEAANIAARDASTTDAQCLYKLGYLPASDKTMRFGYIPEQIIENELPAFNITVTFEVDEAGNPTRQEVYQVPMTGYKDTKFEFGNEILRNHIYTLSVNSVALGAQAELTVNVADWTPNEFNIDFTETVTIAQKLRWTDGSFKSNSNGTLQLLPWTTNAAGNLTYVPLVGTFGLQSPQGATWTAELIATGDTQEPLRFLDQNNQIVPRVSGVVDGKLKTLRIVSTDPDPTVVNSARLVVVVTVGENTYIEVDLTPDNTPDYKNFTIIQNPL